METIEAIQPRFSVPEQGSERETLTGYLTFYRQTLVNKCAGLTFDQLTTRSVPATNMTLLGLIRHAVTAEQHWFERIMPGNKVTWKFISREDQDGDFDDLESHSLAEVMAIFEGTCAASDAEIAARDLDDLSIGDTHHGKVSLRWVLNHMVEDYARHCGHADLIRQSSDGATGY